MQKNGKLFVPVTRNNSTFKDLFARLAAAGAGRPVDQDGFVFGPWTPDLLVEAIANIEANSAGIELRTVQQWFQENDRGISIDNMRWLARIFGCGDPDATSEWQAELVASQARLTAERRAERGRAKIPVPPMADDKSRAVVVQDVPVIPIGNFEDSNLDEQNHGFNLAKTSEALLSKDTSQGLPIVVFVGVAALGLISFTLNIHSVVYMPANGLGKQVGFLWAPNWTIVFLVILPAYLTIFMGLLRSWREDWRSKLLAERDSSQPLFSWQRRIASASYSFWAMLLITVVVASGFNWIATYLMPLLDGDAGGWAVNWGRIAVHRSDIVSIRGAIVFTGLVFLYNALCSFLFFTGLIILHLMTFDYLDIVKDIEKRPTINTGYHIEKIGSSLMIGIYRCTSLGMLIVILMKLQSSFLVSDSPNILDWLAIDIRSLFTGHDTLEFNFAEVHSAPGAYYSFFCMLAIFGIFVNASFRLWPWLAKPQSGARLQTSWIMMNGAMLLLVASYLLTGFFIGFTIVLVPTLIFTVSLVVQPKLGLRNPE